MGCWNETCCLTNMPIKHGDKIMLFPLLALGKYDESKNRFYKPFLFPFEGKYDDYGSIEDISSPNFYQEDFTSFFLDKMNSDSKFFKIEVNGSWDGINKPNNLDEIVLFIERGFLTYNKNKISQMMCHYDVYVSFINEIKNRIPYGQTRTFGELSLERSIKNLTKLLNKPTDDIERFKFDLSFDFLRDIDMKHFLQNYIKPEYFQMYVDNASFISGMELARKSFVPAESGSQIQEMELHKLLAEEVLKVYEKEKEKYIDEYYVDGEDKLEDFARETLFWWSDKDESSM